MVLEDRSLHSLEDRTYGARRSFAYAHSKNFKALRADLQGLCPIFKQSDLQAEGDLQGLRPIFKPQAIYRLRPIFKPQAIFKALSADL